MPSAIGDSVVFPTLAVDDVVAAFYGQPDEIVQYVIKELAIRATDEWLTIRNLLDFFINYASEEHDIDDEFFEAVL